MSIYAVNGKVPVAAWIPSRDDAGNGTTTLNDLVGSSNGTLTNMDPSTDWVADTSAGGIRALDFDGVDDFVTTNYDPFFIQNTLTFGLSIWVEFVANTRLSFLGTTPLASAEKGFGLIREFGFGSGENCIRFGVTLGVLGNSFGVRTADGTAISGWKHIVVTGSGTTASVKIYIDGNDMPLTNLPQGTFNFSTGASTRSMTIGRANFSSLLLLAPHKSDDLRIFNQSLSAPDVSYLYNSGNGRGRTNLQRNHAFIGVAF